MTLPRFLTDPTRIRSRTRLHEQDAADLDLGRRTLLEILPNPGADGRTARAIAHWTAARFGQPRLPSRPESMGEVLTARRGGSQERAVVACFLLRLAGIPARLITEVAYARPRPLPSRVLLTLSPRSSDGFISAGHTWVEAHVEDRWVPLDPNMGLYGMGEWVDARLTPRAAPGPYPYYFPVMVRAVDEAGRAREDRAEHYLIRSIASLVPPDDLTCLEALAVWRGGIHQFSTLLYPRPVFPALRVFSRWPRLRAMSEALKVLLAARHL